MSWGKRIGIGLGVVVGVVGVGVGSLYAITASKRGTQYTVAHAVGAPPVADSALVARGEHVATAIAKCGDCHGDDYAGKVFIDDPAMGHVPAPNLTPGGTAVTADYAAFERAVRHGVGRDGRGLFVMPSIDYVRLHDADLAALYAYLRQLPPVTRPSDAVRLGPVGTMLVATDQLHASDAVIIDHSAPHTPVQAPDTTAAYGEYVAWSGGCHGCHGPGLGGGKIPGTPPDWPPASNISSAGLSGYDYPAFVRAMRDGVRPNNSPLHPVMPVKYTTRMTDVEMRALWLHLQASPARTFGAR